MEKCGTVPQGKDAAGAAGAPRAFIGAARLFGAGTGCQRGQGCRLNFWKVWQSGGTRPALPRKV